jgi:ABC-type branched-subunit amino acid transport system ATPase component
VTLTALPGRVTGLIGPNGAGKTTIFSACTGLLKPTAGRVILQGRDVTTIATPHRARLGLGRTFQRMVLCDSLTVGENVALGREASYGGASPWRQVVSRPLERQVVRRRVAEATALCGIEHLLGEPAGALSTGQRRLVELARAVAGEFSVLLLDEPSSGLDHDETEHLADVVLRMVADTGCAVLMVEHDMGLVMDICPEVHVLDFGRLIYSGSSERARRDEAVRSAYLGEEALVS